MQVRVRPMRRFGQQFFTSEQSPMPAHVGILKVAEVRDLSLERQVLRARLVDLRNESDLIPVLNDARLLHVDGGRLRLTGIERVGDTDYAQTWAVEIAA